MALRVPLERAKPGGERRRGEEEALGFSPPCASCLAPLIQVNWSCTSSLSALSYTPNKHSSAHVRARNQNSVPPAVMGPGACQCIWAQINAVRPQKVAAASTTTPSSVRRGLLFTSLGDFSTTSTAMTPVINKHNAILITSAISTTKGFLFPALLQLFQHVQYVCNTGRPATEC